MGFTPPVVIVKWWTDDAYNDKKRAMEECEEERTGVGGETKIQPPDMTKRI
jgi:hypothetical protein